MRVLFVGRSVYHFSYYQSALDSLSKAGAQISLRFDESWSDGRPDAALQSFLAAHPEIVRRWSSQRGGRSRGLAFAARELRSYSSYLRRPEQSDYYTERWRRYQTKRVKRLDEHAFGRWLLGSAAVGRALSLVETALPTVADVRRDIEGVAPDVVLASPANMRFSEETEYLKAARRMGVATAVLVLSWDNPSTKGLFHVRPDLLLAWNRAHAGEARTYHGIPPRHTYLTGAPFFDKWFDADAAVASREAFCARVGIPAGEPFVLYLGSSANIARDETWLVRQILGELERSRTLRGARLVVRPHPANARPFEQLAASTERVVLWPPAGALPETGAMIADFQASVAHAAGIVGVNTSAMLDSLILDRPCVALITDAYQDTQLRAQHFRHLLQSGALLVAREATECVHQLEQVHAGIDELSPQRRGFVRDFVRPHGAEVAAGDLVAAAVTELGRGTPAERVARMPAAALLARREGTDDGDGR